MWSAVAEGEKEMMTDFQCDYRRSGCVAVGWVTNGRWFCANHMPPGQVRSPDPRIEAADKMAEAIKRHKVNVWGDGDVSYDCDVDLYAALVTYEKATKGTGI